MIVAAPPDWIEPSILLAEELGAGKVRSCVPGGATRSDSVRAALAEVDEDAADLSIRSLPGRCGHEVVPARHATAAAVGVDPADTEQA